MAFEFRLEKVLKFRRRLMEKHTRDVAEANRIVFGINEKLDSLAEDVDRLLNDNMHVMNLTLDVGVMISRGYWLDHLEALKQEMEEELITAEAELENRRSLLTQAWQDQEVLERLREKQKTLWMEEQIKVENKEMDEIGQIRADRHRREKVSGL
jgi:flagellar export protein FliJ